MIDVLRDLGNQIREEALGIWKKYEQMPVSQKRSVQLFLGMLAFFFVSYAYVLYTIGMNWERKEYEWGQVIPLLALVVLWNWRQPIKESSLVEQIAGLTLILLSTLARYISVHNFDMEQFILYSMIINIIGLVLILGGIHMLMWTWPAILLFSLALPFSGKMEFVIFGTLQKYATIWSSFALETLGVDITITGNIIGIIQDGKRVELNVAEACAGFKGMLTALSLTLTVVFLIKAELWIKILLVISSVPIALFANTMRIVIQCICFQFSKEYADIFHDYVAQFVVYPMVFGLLYLEYVMLRNLVVDDVHKTMLPVDRSSQLRLKLPPPSRGT
jgi:exosortase